MEFEGERYVKVNGKKTILGYEKYTQSAKLHQEDAMIALNNKFPNLMGYGFLQYLKELMAIRPDCKYQWCEENIRVMSSMMNMEAAMIKSIVDFCINDIKILRTTHIYRDFERSNEYYLVYPDFLDEIVMLQTKKIMEEQKIERNKHSQEELKQVLNTAQKRKAMVADINKLLIFTPEIKKQAKLFYPGIGDINNLWDDFVEMCTDSYLEYHALLTKENYATMFYTFLNKRTQKVLIENI